MRKILVTAVLIAIAATGLLVSRALFDGPPAEPAAADKGTLYQCPMHPQIVSHEPGTCPICQMKLQRVDSGAATTAPQAEPAAARGPGKILFYRHPMRPDVTSPTPRKDEMGMDYIPVREEDMVLPGGDVPGHAPFVLSAERQQLIGVTRARVERRPLAVEIRAAGKVAYDPMLYQAIVEYREALRARGQLKDSPWVEARAGAEAIIRAAALKLRQQGLSEEQIKSIGKDAADPTNLLLPGKSVWV
jgi:hypothetical protein